MMCYSKQAILSLYAQKELPMLRIVTDTASDITLAQAEALGVDTEQPAYHRPLAA